MKEEVLTWADVEPVCRAAFEGRKPWIECDDLYSEDRDPPKVWYQANSFYVTVGTGRIVRTNPEIECSVGAGQFVTCTIADLEWDDTKAKAAAVKSLREQAAALLAQAEKIEAAD